MTRRERLYALLCELAERGAPCPTNTALGKALGSSTTDASLHLSRLALRRLIAVERRDKRRRVIVLATGKATAWSDHMVGFAAGQVVERQPAIRPEHDARMAGLRFTDVRVKPAPRWRPPVDAGPRSSMAWAAD